MEEEQSWGAISDIASRADNVESGVVNSLMTRSRLRRIFSLRRGRYETFTPHPYFIRLDSLSPKKSEAVHASNMTYPCARLIGERMQSSQANS
jgi:hypothetical protein